MRSILFLAVLLALLWVGWNKVMEIQALGVEEGKPIDLGLPSESLSASNFDEQYLCFDVSTHEWRMFYNPNEPIASDCNGPFIDSSNLCAVMRANNIESVEIKGQNRDLSCD